MSSRKISHGRRNFSLIEPQLSASRSEAPVTTAQARRSTLIVGSVLLVLAAWNLYRGRVAVVAVLGSAGAVLLGIGVLFPTGARIFHVAWMRLAAALGYVNSRVLLTLMYFLAVTPYGFVSRLLGRDPLRRRGVGGESYWVARRHTKQSKEQFERLF